MNTLNCFVRPLLLSCCICLTLYGCYSNSKPKPIISYTPESLVQQVRFTVGLEIIIVDQNNYPLKGVRVSGRNPFFSHVVTTGQSGTALIHGVFVEGQKTLLEFEGQGIRWTEELTYDLPGKTDIITIVAKSLGDGSIKLTSVKYQQH